MLRDQISEALRTSMKAKEVRATATLRLIMAALKDRDIAARSKGNMDGINEEEILSMLQSMIKQRRESIDMYEKGGRLELAQQEAEEIDIIERFLPAQMSAEEMDAAIQAVIDELDAQTMKDMGRTMGALKQRHAGSMDFSRASAMVKEKLS